MLKMDGASGTPLASSLSLKDFLYVVARDKPTLSVNQKANPAPGLASRNYYLQRKYNLHQHVEMDQSL
jgi:hypothetical protein